MRGGIDNYGNLTLNFATITGNALDAGGIWNQGTLTLNAVAVSGNQSKGIVNDYSGNMTLTNVIVSDNTGGGLFAGAGIYNDGTATLTDVTISGNTIDNSGANLRHYFGQCEQRWSGRRHLQLGNCQPDQCDHLGQYRFG